MERSDHHEWGTETEPVPEPFLPLDHRADHPRGVGEGAEDQDQDQGREVEAAARPAQAGAQRETPEMTPGRTGEDPDVVVRAGVDAIEAEGAVEVAHLARLEQAEFTAGDGVRSPDAIASAAGRADALLAHRH